jgi:hypothetical protein
MLLLFRVIPEVVAAIVSSRKDDVTDSRECMEFLPLHPYFLERRQEVSALNYVFGFRNELNFR